MDSGNNNFLPTSAKANYLPYGSNFAHGPTGRFTNGRTVADFIAEYLGLPYPPPYLSLHGQMSLSGINYASGSCGILPESGALLGKCKSLSEQINLFEWTIETNIEISQHLSKSIYLVAVGSNDYINNYLETKFDTSKRYHPQTFAHLLIHNLSQEFQRLYKLGGRKIVMFEIGPLGCLPSISKTHLHKGDCLEETNQIVSYFNEMLPSMLNNLTFTLPHSFFVLGRINSKVYDAVTNPTTYGLTDGKSPCCRTWENASAVCIPLTVPCINPFQHIFWDGYHLTEPFYSFLASQCLHADSLCTPLSIQQLVKM
ncbi:hypothetical protein PIB30_079509 [Stylosanthes scabra]|uniref:GDSL esterase/lipase 7 n=1 Tax=Stylosanthes scabra TaxID=79078 RepID=A0ABU6VRI1_9FABA|nr:hypothetical protein [Stylosanthes scabra]